MGGLREGEMGCFWGLGEKIENNDFSVLRLCLKYGIICAIFVDRIRRCLKFEI